MSPILYLFYNAELLEKVENNSLRTSGVGFVDDVNILTYGANTMRNCETLKRIHTACEEWARRHGSQFNPDKYELIHLTRRPSRYEMNKGLQIGSQVITPSANIRVLGVQIDSALRWQAHVRDIEAKAQRTLSAVRSLTGSTWGASQAAGRKLYTAVTRPIIAYGANAWYTPQGVKGHRKWVVSKLKAIQGQHLRTITGAYRATSTEAVEIETDIPPIDIHLEKVIAKTILRISTSPASRVVDAATRQIRQQMRSKGTRLAKTGETEGQRKKKWVHTRLGELDGHQLPTFKEPPWQLEQVERGHTADEEHTQRLQTLQVKADKSVRKAWRERWRQGDKGQHLRRLVPVPSPANRKLHAGRLKPESALLTQLRTGKVGFNDFLYNRRVPGVWSRRCPCGQGPMTVLHVLLLCSRWNETRTNVGLLGSTDLKAVLTSRKGATAATRFVIQTGLLEQFRLYAGETQG